MSSKKFRIHESENLYRTLLDSIQTNNERLTLINYSPGLKIEIDSIMDRLNLNYNIINFREIRQKNYKDRNDEPSIFEFVKTLLEIGLGIINPVIGTFTDLKDIGQMILKMYNKALDKDILSEELNYNHKSKIKFKKVKKIIYIPDLNLISDIDFKYASYISTIINDMFIVDTYLIVTQSKEKLNKNLCGCFQTYNFFINESILMNFQMEESSDLIKLIDKVGIEYIEDINKLIKVQEINNPKTKDLLNLLLNNIEETGLNKKEVHRFLKFCSLLFDQFSQADLEQTTNLSFDVITSLIENTKNIHLIKQLDKLKRDYSFSLDFFRKFYQENYGTLTEDEYTFIFKYLSLNYPYQYSNLALASLLLLRNDYEKLCFNIKAFYHERRKLTQQKKDEITSFLSQFDIGKTIIELDTAFVKSKISNEHIDKCKELFYLLDTNNDIDNETKLCCLYFICRCIYDTKEYDFALELMEKYLEIYTDLNVVSEYQPYINEYIIDTIVFSTFTDFSKYAKAIQRLNVIIKDKDIEKTAISQNKLIRYYRLGNLLYSASTSKGLKMTEKAYRLSKDVLLKELAIINYSVSLIFNGYYSKAVEIMDSSELNLHMINLETEITYQNNYIIAKFYNKDYDVSKVYKEFTSLYTKYSSESFNDIFILKNNYISSMIEFNYKNEKDEILKLCNEIINSNDDFHIFFAMMNKLMLYYLLHEKENFRITLNEIKVPILYKNYSEFFKAKFLIIQDCFDRELNLHELSLELDILSSRFEESKGYRTFLQPVVFGLIERWFE